jgi:hypothetical protein
MLPPKQGGKLRSKFSIKCTEVRTWLIRFAISAAPRTLGSLPTFPLRRPRETGGDARRIRVDSSLFLNKLDL